MCLKSYPIIIITEPDQDALHIRNLLTYRILRQEEQEEQEEQEPDTTGYESATVFHPVQGLYQPTVVYAYPATNYNTIWGPRYIPINYFKQHTIKNCVKDDCVEHIIMDRNNKIQTIYITSKPNINSKQKISDEKLCSICTEDFVIDDNILNVCCMNKCCSNHFHTSCINKWILKNFKQNKCPSCPLCRKSIKTNYNLMYNNLHPLSPVNYNIDINSQDIETETTLQYFCQSIGATHNQHSSNPSPTISNNDVVPNINNMINTLMNSHDIDVFTNQVD